MREHGAAAGAVQTFQFPLGHQVVSLHIDVDESEWNDQHGEHRSTRRDDRENEDDPGDIVKQGVELTGKSFIDTIHVT